MHFERAVAEALDVKVLEAVQAPPSRSTWLLPPPSVWEYSCLHHTSPVARWWQRRVTEVSFLLTMSVPSSTEGSWLDVMIPSFHLTSLCETQYPCPYMSSETRVSTKARICVQVHDCVQ